MRVRACVDVCILFRVGYPDIYIDATVMPHKATYIYRVRVGWYCRAEIDRRDGILDVARQQYTKANAFAGKQRRQAASSIYL